MTPITTKTCNECGGKITGRADKKFCSDECRIAHNNKIRTPSNKLVRHVTHTLLRNRRILAELNPSGKTRVNLSKLQEMGFNFNYFTSIYTTREGAEYRYCFEQGYLAMEGNSYLLVVRKEV
jgi:predicted nucleic acid-binding Zn ribbon protein